MTTVDARAWDRLPGWEMISAGLADFAAGRVTANACAVAMAAPRLQRAGLLPKQQLATAIAEPEICLYRLLGAGPGNAFGQYQAILRRLIRFEHALDRLMTRRSSVEAVGRPGKDNGPETRGPWT